MYGDRRTAAYREGVHSFRDAADANKHGGGYMFCLVETMLGMGTKKWDYFQF
jgi:hypothetical protein